MKNSQTIHDDDIRKLSKLSNLPLTQEKEKVLKDKLNSSLDFINEIKYLNTENVEETSQVTGLENVFRADEIDKSRLLSQEEVLKNAKSTHKGYFKVKAVFDEE